MAEEFNLPKIEEEILEFWKANRIFEKSLELRRGAKKFIFYEGPPYANGKPGVHHVLARVFKDIILRYKTMRGYFVPRRAGWDTHGLPVEMATEKALGLKSKKDIEKFGIKLFNQKAKELVWIYKDEWEKMTERIGYWLDLKNAYITYEPEYIETIWWTIAQIAKRKLLYRGHKVVPWCTRCGTALSSHELALGYKETEDNSVYVKFKIKSKISNLKTDVPVYILSWTTTPWTLPGNVALAIGEKIIYAAVRVDGAKEIYILARDLISAVFKDRRVDVVLGEIKGKNLVGLEYEPLFDIKPLRSKNSYRIYAADFVSTDEGTGVVHTAVMYGEDDYKLGKKFDLPQRHTVDEEGKFTKDVPGLARLYVKSPETEKKILNYLQKRGNLFAVEKYVHEYPYCWRCDSPVLYYARDSWFIAMSKLREELLAANKKINWIPQHIKEGRFGEWLRKVKDWNLSRERYWGAPLPIWECEKCGAHEIVGSLAELDRLVGGSKNKYWTMRHGESFANVMRILDDRKKGGARLTKRGIEQVRRAAEAFRKELEKKKEKVDLIIYSDIPRARETAEIVAEVLGVKRTLPDKRLEEIHLGELEGCHDRRYHELYPTYESKFENRPENGESLRDLRKRVWDFLADVEKKYSGKNILLVSHEYPIWMMEHAARGWSEKRAIAEKIRRGKDYVGLAKISELGLIVAPRNDSGEIDLHRPFVDEVVFRCRKCPSARFGQAKGRMRRIKEVADVWYDSGAMPFAQAHWPFAQVEADFRQNYAEEGRRSVSGLRQSLSRLEYPADYIAEAIDQTRGWFYTLLAVAVALGYGAPYKNVISLGLISDKFGQKMSKSKGNIVDPWAVIDKYGADALRWYFYTVNPPGEPKNFDEAEAHKAYRRMHLLAYNSLVFWKTYAKRNWKFEIRSSKNVLDKWIIARLDEVIANTTKNLDKYEVRDAALEIERFVSDLSRWYIRRSRRRFSAVPKGSGGQAKAGDYKAASATLGLVLSNLAKLLAPFTPFFAEHLWKELGGKGSVHLEEWPKINQKSKIKNQKLLGAMEEIRKLASAALAKRAEAGIKVRQPLAKLKISNLKSQISSSKALLGILKEEVNVKEIVFDPKIQGEVELDVAITPELKEEGTLRELARAVQELRQKAGLKPKDKVVVMLELPEPLRGVVLRNEKLLKFEVGAKAIEYKKEKFDAEISTEIDGEKVWLAVRKI